jgi:NADPH:quinone reductase-like Zn-dependent oxidoreductase
MARLAVQSMYVDQLRTITAAGLTKKDAMVTLARHLEAGELTPVIDRTYPLEEAAAALRHLMAGEPIGRVVLTT